jgi:hypothetical protein
VIEIRAESERGILTTTLTTKAAFVGAKYGRWRTHDGTGLLEMDTDGLYCVELENRQERKYLVVSSPALFHGPSSAQVSELLFCSLSSSARREL